MVTTVEKQLIKEVEEMSREAQEKMLKIVHFMKKEILAEKKKPVAKQKDIMALIPKKRMGRILMSMRREDIYTDAR